MDRLDDYFRWVYDHEVSRRHSLSGYFLSRVTIVGLLLGVAASSAGSYKDYIWQWDSLEWILLISCGISFFIIVYFFYRFSFKHYYNHLGYPNDMVDTFEKNLGNKISDDSSSKDFLSVVSRELNDCADKNCRINDLRNDFLIKIDKSILINFTLSAAIFSLSQYSGFQNASGSAGKNEGGNWIIDIGESMPYDRPSVPRNAKKVIDMNKDGKPTSAPAPAPTPAPTQTRPNIMPRRVIQENSVPPIKSK